MTINVFRYQNNFYSDMGSGLPVEAVAIAAELKKGRSRTRAFPIHRAIRVHKTLHNGYHHHFQVGPHQPVTPLRWTAEAERPIAALATCAIKQSRVVSRWTRQAIDTNNLNRHTKWYRARSLVTKSKDTFIQPQTCGRASAFRTLNFLHCDRRIQLILRQKSAPGRPHPRLCIEASSRSWSRQGLKLLKRKIAHIVIRPPLEILIDRCTHGKENLMKGGPEAISGTSCSHRRCPMQLSSASQGMSSPWQRLKTCHCQPQLIYLEHLQGP